MLGCNNPAHALRHVHFVVIANDINALAALTDVQLREAGGCNHRSAFDLALELNRVEIVHAFLARCGDTLVTRTSLGSLILSRNVHLFDEIISLVRHDYGFVLGVYGVLRRRLVDFSMLVRYVAIYLSRYPTALVALLETCLLYREDVPVSDALSKFALTVVSLPPLDCTRPLPQWIGMQSLFLAEQLGFVDVYVSRGVLHTAIISNRIRFMSRYLSRVVVHRSDLDYLLDVAIGADCAPTVVREMCRLLLAHGASPWPAATIGPGTRLMQLFEKERARWSVKRHALFPATFRARVFALLQCVRPLRLPKDIVLYCLIPALAAAEAKDESRRQLRRQPLAAILRTLDDRGVEHHPRELKRNLIHLLEMQMNVPVINRVVGRITLQSETHEITSAEPEVAVGREIGPFLSIAHIPTVSRLHFILVNRNGNWRLRVCGPNGVHVFPHGLLLRSSTWHALGPAPITLELPYCNVSFRIS